MTRSWMPYDLTLNVNGTDYILYYLPETRDEGASITDVNYRVQGTWQEMAIDTFLYVYGQSIGLDSYRCLETAEEALLKLINLTHLSENLDART